MTRTDESFEAAAGCPTCTGTPTVPTPPTGSGAVAECLRCGERFMRDNAGGVFLYPGGPLDDEALADRRRR